MTLALDVVTRLDPVPGVTGGLRALGGVVAVLGLVCLLAWLVRRGTLKLPGSRARVPIAIEAAMPLGDRRSLMVVTIEGRRLLLGVTPTQVSLVTELAAGSFSSSLDRRLGGPPEAA